MDKKFSIVYSSLSIFL